MPRRSFFLLPLVLIPLLAGSACVERSKVPTDAGSATPAPAATTGTTDTTAPASGEQTAAPTKTCPVPRPDAACTKDYKPVVCDGCEYANPCLALAAGYRKCMAKIVKEADKACPTPSPGFVCTTEYAPVKCDGCLYPNACTAGAAGFNKEQCAPALGEE